MTAPLPLEGAARCGYCLRALVLQPGGHWQCPRCAPLLATLGAGMDYDGLLTEFALFQRRAWRDRVRSR